MSLLLWRHDRVYLVEPGERLETDLGIIEIPDDVEVGSTIESHLGETFLALNPRPTDYFDHLERSGAPMLPRDIGLVIGLAGITAGDRVLDVGTGTGILAITLGQLEVKVETIERDQDAAALARENIEIAGVADHVTVTEGDGMTLEFEGLFDTITLDTGDAADIIERAPALLAPGGVVAAYSPFIEDARDIVEALRSVGFDDIRSFEPLFRQMDFGERGSRPSTAPVGHTGYFTTARYYPDTTDME